MRERTFEEIDALAKATGTSRATTLRVIGRKTPQPWAAANFARQINEFAPLKPLGKGHTITPEEPMTPRQRECFDFIKSYWAEHECSPSYEDIMAGLGLKGKSRVFALVSALQQRGVISRVYGHPRSIRVLTQCPCCGRG